MTEKLHSGVSASAGRCFDVVGIGFGPANLALAIANEEAPENERLDAVFLDAKPGFVWHPGMLNEGSMLQITVLKDLVLIENPCSTFTFLNYLKTKGRLYDFLNLRDLFPTRIEFNDYLGWAAERLAHTVRWGRRVQAVLPEGDPTAPELLRVVAHNAATGETEEYLTRHLVLAAGGEPWVPEGVSLRPDGRVIHPFEFKQRIAAFGDRDAPYKFIVTGGGQSGGELFEYLIDRYPNADVTATVRNFSYKPVDESDFTNRVFFPEWVDHYYGLPEPTRNAFLDELRDLNYAAIDHPLIKRIYRKLYDQKVLGKERARFLPFLDLERVEEGADGVTVTYRHVQHGHRVTLEADALVLCTGFVWRKEHRLIEGLAPWFERDRQGGYQVRRDYAIASAPGFKPNVYLQGYCEQTHGISETVLSLIPVRAREIQRSILAALETERQNALETIAT
ncbi:MAG: lysine N(6)-hydroxylase/L-ornithine N(5)-oxygenase family protein [Thermoanaerobaculia bacterium]|nr:lysine N(6)-hydroxylase/L-ornithine N(5)-oxygenase family protein [Thermoanaerobaculia bacterium]